MPLNDFINSLIPDRFKLTYELKTKVRGVIITQILFGFILINLGLFYWFNGHILYELLLNTVLGIILIVLIFFIDKFNKYETYINF